MSYTYTSDSIIKWEEIVLKVYSAFYFDFKNCVFSDGH